MSLVYNHLNKTKGLSCGEKLCLCYFVLIAIFFFVVKVEGDILFPAMCCNQYVL